MERLHPCPACARHVRASERACPFCDAQLTIAPSLTGQPVGRLGRAALFAFRTTTVAALGTLPVACGDDQPPEPPPHTVMQPYGAPPNPPEPPPLPPPPVEDSVAQPYGAPPDPQPEPPVEPPPVDPPTHDQEHSRPRRTVTIPAYGIAPHDDELDLE